MINCLTIEWDDKYPKTRESAINIFKAHNIWGYISNFEFIELEGYEDDDTEFEMKFDIDFDYYTGKIEMNSMWIESDEPQTCIDLYETLFK